MISDDVSLGWSPDPICSSHTGTPEALFEALDLLGANRSF